MPSQERRRSPRIDKNIPLKITCEDFDIVTESKNLSSTGAYCLIDKPLEPMTKLKIQLLLPLKRKEKTTIKKICCEGVVVRTQASEVQKQFSIAIYFSDITEKDKKCIIEYVAESLNKKPAAE